MADTHSRTPNVNFYSAFIRFHDHFSSYSPVYTIHAFTHSMEYSWFNSWNPVKYVWIKVTIHFLLLYAYDRKTHTHTQQRNALTIKVLFLSVLFAVERVFFKCIHTIDLHRLTRQFSQWQGWCLLIVYWILRRKKTFTTSRSTTRKMHNKRRQIASN